MMCIQKKALYIKTWKHETPWYFQANEWKYNEMLGRLIEDEGIQPHKGQIKEVLVIHSKDFKKYFVIIFDK